MHRNGYFTILGEAIGLAIDDYIKYKKFLRHPKKIKNKKTANDIRVFGLDAESFLFGERLQMFLDLFHLNTVTTVAAIRNRTHNLESRIR